MTPWKANVGGGAAGLRKYLEQHCEGHHAAEYMAHGHTVTMLEFTAAAGEIAATDLTGDRFEQWISGVDVHTGHDKGVLQKDRVMVMELSTNCPKTLSLAAAGDPVVAAAVTAAMGRASKAGVQEYAGTLTVRTGARGAVSEVPVDSLEAVIVDHGVSREGQPHQHQHVLVSARVPAEGGWYAVHTRAMMRMSAAWNGTVRLTIQSDPELRRVLAERGWTMNGDGEIAELVEFGPAMSAGSKRVKRNVRRYDREWRAANPGDEPPQKLRRIWDRRAWADGRPSAGKADTEAWRGWADTIGLTFALERERPALPVPTSTPLDDVDVDGVAARALDVLSAGGRGRSAWNVFEVRGAVKDVLSESGVVGDRDDVLALAASIADVAEAACLPILAEPKAPHIRQLTSVAIVELDRDLRGRFARRANAVVGRPAVCAVPAGLDDRQADAVRALAGTQKLVVIEGPGGSGKTTFLAPAKALLEAAGKRMVVVAPSNAAAIRAAEAVGADHSSAHKLAYLYGWRWDTQGVWTRLADGDVDPETGQRVKYPAGESALLRRGDLLVVDEAAMLDQWTARAVVTVADEIGARVALVGDPQQIRAVGIGGVMQIAASWQDPIVLDGVYRFRTADNRLDHAYAELSLRVRDGVNPEATFDELSASGHVQVVATEDDAVQVIADDAAARAARRETLAASAATNEQTQLLNAAIRERLVTAGLVDDTRTVTGMDGEPIGAGDRVATRKNNSPLGVSNRQTWTVAKVHDDGSLSLRGEDTNRQRVTVPAGYVQQQVQHAYASTVHGIQGATDDAGTLLLSDAVGADAAYVGLSRGRFANTVVVVAPSMEDARAQWVAASGRDRADLGLDHARRLAEAEARAYERRSAPVPEIGGEQAEAWAAYSPGGTERYEAAQSRGHGPRR